MEYIINKDLLGVIEIISEDTTHFEVNNDNLDFVVNTGFDFVIETEKLSKEVCKIMDQEIIDRVMSYIRKDIMLFSDAAVGFAAYRLEERVHGIGEWKRLYGDGAYIRLATRFLLDASAYDSCVA